MRTPRPTPSLAKLLAGAEMPKVDGISLGSVAPLALPEQTDHDKHLTVRQMQEELMGAVLALQEGLCCGIFHCAQMANAENTGPVVDLVVFKEIDGRRVPVPNRFGNLGHINCLIAAGRKCHELIVLDHNTNANHQPYLDQVRELMKSSAWEKKTAIITDIPSGN